MRRFSLSTVAICVFFVCPTVSAYAERFSDSDEGLLGRLAQRASIVDQDLARATQAELKSSGISIAHSCLEYISSDASNIDDNIEWSSELMMLDRLMTSDKDEVHVRGLLKNRVETTMKLIDVFGQEVRDLLNDGGCASEAAASARMQSWQDFLDVASEQLKPLSYRLERRPNR